MIKRVFTIFIYLTSLGYSNSEFNDLCYNFDNNKSKKFIQVKRTSLNSKEIKNLKARENHAVSYNREYQIHLWNVKSKIINTMNDF